MTACFRLAHFPGFEQHAAHLVQITACVDINEERAKTMAEKAGGGCKAFTSLEAALAEGDFDAVDLMLLHTVPTQPFFIHCSFILPFSK